ncbi:MAG TPA: hypothetical protein VK509_00215, partial [Polyangiales bacterium]|nr:hypothetical protein [Polyangiales bacterium]
MKPFRTLFPILGVVTALAGCSGESSTNDSVEAPAALQQPAAATSDAEAGDKSDRPRAGRSHGGPGFLVMAAL